MIKKLMLLLLLPAAAFAQPKSIHYSALGAFVVDENGHQVTVKGHPKMICFIGPDEEIHGTFQKIRPIDENSVMLYMSGWSLMDYEETGKKTIQYFTIPNPVCDLK